MRAKEFSPHIFWSYNPSANLPDEIVIKQVILYGEIKDKIHLVKLAGKDKILEVIRKWSPKRNEEKHIYFMENVILS